MASSYWAATEDAVSERRRLELLEARYDPLTFRRLSALAPSEGWSCLEVAAGAGSVARWLAARVRVRGRVVATDVDPRFLGGMLPANIEIRQHDILTDPLEESAFDLVHCRALLCHLDEPMVALTRMTAALRPGGWLLVEGADYVTLEAACLDHPLAPAWNRMAARVARFMAGAGFVDPHQGRRLPGLLSKLGLEQRSHEGLVRIHDGGTPAAEFMRHSLEAFRDQLTVAGVASPTELDAACHALADPSFSFVDAINYAAWGRRGDGPSGLPTRSP